MLKICGLMRSESKAMTLVFVTLCENITMIAIILNIEVDGDDGYMSLKNHHFLSVMAFHIQFRGLELELTK